INLVLEKEIGREPFGLGWVYMSRAVREGEAGRRWFAVKVLNIQLHRNGWPDAEFDRHLGAEAGVLRSLADVENQRHFPLAGVFAVDEAEHVFNLQPAQLRYHRLARDDLDIHKTVLDIILGDVARFLAVKNRERLRTRH